MTKTDPNYPSREAKRRFDQALRGALNTPPTPLKSRAGSKKREDEAADLGRQKGQRRKQR